MTVEDIKEPVKEEMALFEKKFKAAMKSDVALLDKITHYIIKRKGKQLRPLFVFLSAKMLGAVNEGTYIAASLIELLHTATLVHDDVVDDASERRGFLSINALWKNKIAVLVGDFLLSQGLLLTTSKNRIDLLHIVSKAVKAMSEGELLQMEKSRKMDITENIYYKIIEQKTASLVAACCGTGACSVTDDKKIISAGVALTHLHLNDNTVAGISLIGKKAFSVQYHPESSPGPNDSRYLFDQFVENIKKQ